MRNRRWTGRRALLILSSAILASFAAQAQVASPAKSAGETPLHRAAKEGDLASLRARLKAGANPDLLDSNGRTALLEAARAGQTEAVRLLLASGARVNGVLVTGKAPLIEAAEQGQIEAAQVLIDSGADLNIVQRGSGTALETAERNGRTEMAAMLRQAGARTFGRSVGDTVCVRPWNGEGYCGAVQSIDKTAYTIRVTMIVGCELGCPERAECSASKPVGGTDGLRVGDTITTVTWCLTDTGVKQ